MDKIKVALVHDWLTGQRGGEKVLEVLAEIFPRAPIYTLFHLRGSQIEAIERRDIRTSFLQKMPFLRKRYRYYLPLFPLAVEMFDLADYELVVSSSHCVAKGAIPAPDALHISYVHSPVRYAWNQYFAYFSPDRLSFFSRRLIPPVIHRLRVWDESSAARVDQFVANSENVARRIRKYYRRTADVIHPPVDTDFFQPPAEEPARSDYLIVSALVPYKRIDLAVRTFNRSGERLTVVGTGPDLGKLKKLARPNVTFLGQVSGAGLRALYQRAKALLIPGEEDFGITALEAQACGTPVIAFGRGGALESVIPGETGLFFSELSVEALASALDNFKGLKFNKPVIRANAEKFSRPAFRQKTMEYFRRKWADYKGQR
jgi:glycosyltransferase involved in cell wall biosynthesis